MAPAYQQLRASNASPNQDRRHLNSQAYAQLSSQSSPQHSPRGYTHLSPQQSPRGYGHLSPQHSPQGSGHLTPQQSHGHLSPHLSPQAHAHLSPRRNSDWSRRSSVSYNSYNSYNQYNQYDAAYPLDDLESTFNKSVHSDSRSQADSAVFLTSSERKLKRSSSRWSEGGGGLSWSSINLKEWWQTCLRSGWRFGVLSCAVAASLVFLINLAITIWAAASMAISGGTGTLFEGSCDKTRPLNVGIHLVINILSTIMLSSSNYCMQCLSAPTRREIDRAHLQGWWLDIGVLSFRNLRRISWRRSLVWTLLALSSLPLHLFYNSTVFSTLGAYSYSALMVDEPFITSTDPSSLNITLGRNHHMDHNFLAGGIQEDYRSGRAVKLSNAECIKTYARDFQTANIHVFVVVDNAQSEQNSGINGSILDLAVSSTPRLGEEQGGSWNWLCCGSRGCASPCVDQLPSLQKDPENWKPFGLPAKYCVSQVAPQHCKLQFSVPLAVLVVVMNLTKSCIMLWMVFGYKEEEPIMTMGDAVSSFLQNPDKTTVNMCLVAGEEVRAVESDWREVSDSPRVFSTEKQRWFAAAGKVRWLLCIAMYTTAILLISGLLGWGIQGMPGETLGFAPLWKLGFGAVTPLTFISWKSSDPGLIGNILVANAPQVLFSVLYFALNSLFTCMLLAQEWSAYALRRKGLRVSGIPIGEQRTTYRLQLPYRYAVPLMVASGLVHWLISQSIFLVNIESRSMAGEAESAEQSMELLTTCGYSPSAIMCVIALGVGVVLFTVGIGFRRFQAAMPIAGSCSIAISAACHPQPGRYEKDDVYGRLKWGATTDQTMIVGHCAFSSEDVREPGDGTAYAGHPCRAH